MVSYHGEGAPRNMVETVQQILNSGDADKFEKALIALAKKIDTVGAETKEVNQRTRRLRRYGGR